ncbi:hypothetical protein EVAR_49684_1 [Eumeta japonica]|uniref:Uncharacterized protein n=1 Tax=Eumeta variegata TaxID=151549 RepID=A0A4C1WTN8_EUMVA|nr:hypothetical protein EVAR_49684_1 [Eumeta japonica]
MRSEMASYLLNGVSNSKSSVRTTGLSCESSVYIRNDLPEVQSSNDSRVDAYYLVYSALGDIVRTCRELPQINHYHVIGINYLAAASPFGSSRGG